MDLTTTKNGIRKMFFAACLALGGAVLSLVSTLAASAGGLDLLFTFAGLCSLAAFIVQLIGLHKAKASVPPFGIAFFAILAHIAAVVAVAVVTMQTNQTVNAVVTNISAPLLVLLEAFAYFCILRGIGLIGDRLSDTAFTDKAKKLLFIALALFGVSLVCNVLSAAVPKLTHGLKIVDAVAYVGVYALYLLALLTVKKLLDTSPAAVPAASDDAAPVASTDDMLNISAVSISDETTNGMKNEE